ncbi:MAG: hypothetical protein RRZ67_04425 [Victivallaceae bacterium]
MVFSSDASDINLLTHHVNIQKVPSTRLSSDIKIERLKVVGIILLSIGLLSIVLGLAMAAVLSNLFIILVAVMGLILTVLAGIFLIKTKRLESQSGISELLADPLRDEPIGKFDSPIPEVKIVHDFSPERSVAILKRYFPRVIVVDKTYSLKRKLVRKVLSNGRGCYLTFAKGTIMKIQYSPCQTPNKTALVFCDRYSQSVGAALIRRCTDEEVFKEFERERANKLQGEFLLAKWSPSSTWVPSSSQERGLFLKWDFLYRLNVPNTPMDPQSKCVSLKVSFKNLFIDCIERGITVLQMPLVCCEPVYQQDTQWGRAVIQAITEALAEAGERVSCDTPFCVNIVSKIEISCSELVKDL